MEPGNQAVTAAHSTTDTYWPHRVYAAQSLCSMLICAGPPLWLVEWLPACTSQGRLPQRVEETSKTFQSQWIFTHRQRTQTIPNLVPRYKQDFAEYMQRTLPGHPRFDEWDADG